MEQQQYYKKNETDEEVNPIRWSNIIFLPFQSWWKFLVLLVVISKCLFGPLSTIYSIHCSEYLDNNVFLFYFKRFYAFICEPIYVVDTFLYIIHRQVTEEAMRREHLPKSAFLLLLDMVAIIPFFGFKSSEICPPVQLWPNILGFNELLIVYRVVEYFELTMTHTVWKIILGYAIILLLYINSLTCFFLLLTFEGLCDNCHENIYDWRAFFIDKFNKTDDVTTYIYASAFVLAITVHKLIDETKPSTYLEFVFCIVVMVFGYLLLIFIMMPKLFAEGVLNIRHICTFHPRINRIIDETKRRNPSPTAHRSVEKFYALIWSKNSGLTTTPKVIAELPFYLKLNITQDLVWPVFHHSPTFRNTSLSYKRWLCEHINYDYKLPGEKFFVGIHGYSNLYYIKSGIVQLISTEDNSSPMLSVTGGTLFGDISFFVPPRNRKVDVRCLTYCEVYSVPRSSIITSLYKFPEDGRNIIRAAKERIKHAKTLYNCKNNIRGLDRSEDEGISWVKRRWWEINDAIKLNKKNTHVHVPLEETNYHCAKFIGQLVLTKVELRTKSMFVKVEFPWILAPHSMFGDIWHRVVIATVYLVLLILPPVIATMQTQEEISKWFAYFIFFTDFVYTADIFVYLLTAVVKKGNIETRFISIMFERCKQVFFVLDILSTAWIENFVSIIGYSKYYYVCQFNRLIKTYMLYFNKYKSVWEKDKDPMDQVIYAIALTHFYFGYVLGFFLFTIIRLNPNLTPHYFYGDICTLDNNTQCEGMLEILAGWLFQTMFPEYEPNDITDCILAMITVILFFLMHLYTKSKLVSTLYIKYREMINYYFFVSNLKKHYNRHRTHPHLLVRLDRYLICQWKYYNGMDILHPRLLKELPYDIYYKFHGQLAEKLIAESHAFKWANPALIRELANKAEFLILPQNSTLSAFGVYAKNVMWIANGTVECQYFTDEGEVLKTFHDAGTLLTFSTVFLKKSSLRQYTAATEIEILYIRLTDFFSIIKRYQLEWSHIESCVLEFIPQFDRSYQTYLRKNQSRQKKLRENIFFALKDSVDKNDKKKQAGMKSIFTIFMNYRTNPESIFIRYWMKFRVAVVVISITSSALQGGSGATIRPYLMFIGYLCDIVAYADILLKMFVPFYDDRGLIISNVRNCLIHYLTRGFLVDFIGALPWDLILKEVLDDVGQNDICLVKTSFKFCHIYILLGFFNYLADLPTVNIACLMIIKWQLVTLLLMFGASIFLIDKCIEFKWDNNYNLIYMERRNSCWYPNYLKLDDKPTVEQLYNVFVESLNLAQCGLLMINLGKFHVLPHDRISMSVCFLIIGVIFWYITSYCETLLILHYRGNKLFQHGVRQLNKYLTAERVAPQLITRAVNHFIYVWIRTKGVNVQTLMNERIGAVFRQDLSYFFFKNTLSSVDTLLGGGESLERSLASNVFQIHFLPKEDIIREMQLSSSIFIVHRGKVVVSKDGEKLYSLKKGSIFGQLEGSDVRPIRITAQSAEHTDLLHITVKQFQDIISDDVRENIRDNPQSRYDFMAVKKICIENPYNSIEYILRERKTIKLPWMLEPVSAENNFSYSQWLFCVWLCAPVITAILALLIEALPNVSLGFIARSLILFDILHLVHIVSELFTMEVQVIDNKCVKKYIRLKSLLNLWYSLDVASIVVPLLTFVTDDTSFQLARLLRIHSVCLYQRHFCRNFQTRYAPVLVKFVMVLLLLHAFTCGWIIVACSAKKNNEFPVTIPKLPYNISETINPDEWIHPNLRKNGCPRCTKTFNSGNKEMLSFVVSTKWYADYVVALTYIVIIQTHTNMDTVVPLTEAQMYYKLTATVILYLIEMWITCVCISSIYTRFREMYYYDYHVINLMTYMKHNGLSDILLQSLKRYTKLLWQRQRGNWLPEITQLAPTCLREDILSALYMHHLEAVPLFKQLPIYFLRQLVARLNRVVVFPGNNIVLEGDLFPCIYFIHEGEVEKWYTDASGEPRMLSVLTINGYFGLVAGLFPDVSYKFSYYTRTVVDLVYLHYYDWQDLLNSYPDVKNDVYVAASKLKNK